MPVKKVLHVPCGHNQLKYSDRHIFVESFPMGIDYDKFVRTSSRPEVNAIATQFRSHFPNQKIIISVDRLDYSKGILERLRAFLTFLEKYPEWHSKVVLYMLIVPSRDKVSQYKKLKDEINRKVSEINSIYGNLSWTPVLYFYKSLPFEELIGLYIASDICMITSTRDGMNLVSKEYIACKTNSDGVLILSEFAGASKELVDALIVNPYNRVETADSIYHAIRMPPEEIRERTEANRQIIQKFNVHHWVRLFLDRMAETKAIQRDEWARRISDKVFNSIAERYRQSHNRLFFFWIMTAHWSNFKIMPRKPAQRFFCTISWIVLSPIRSIRWSSSAGVRRRAYLPGLMGAPTIWSLNMGYGLIFPTLTGPTKRAWHYTGCQKSKS